MAGAAEPKYIPSRKDTSRKKLGSWRIRYVGSDGRRYSITGKTKTGVAADYDQEVKAMALGTWIPPQERERQRQAEAKTVREAVTDWLENRKLHTKESTYQEYRKALKNRVTGIGAIHGIADIPLSKLTARDANEWYDAISRNFSTPSTNRRAHVYLRAAISHAVRNGVVAENVVQVDAAKKRPDTKEKELPTASELQAIVDNAPERYKLVFVLALFHGLRLGEAIGLKGENLVNLGTATNPRYVVQIRGNLQRVTDENGRACMTYQTTKTKAGRRDVPIFAKFNDTVKKHLDQFAPADPSDYLTRTNQGRPVLDTSLRNVLKTARNAAEVTKPISFHYGRNFLITLMSEKGATLKEVGQLLGQEDLKTITDVYMKARPSNITSILDRVADTIEEEQQREN